MITNTIVTQPVIATIQPGNQELSATRAEPQIIALNPEAVKEVNLDDIQNIQILSKVIVPPLKPDLMIAQEFQLRKDALTVDELENSGRKESTISVKSFSSQASDNVQYAEQMSTFQSIPEQNANVEPLISEIATERKVEIEEEASLPLYQYDGYSETPHEFVQSDAQDKIGRFENVESSQSTSPVHGNFVPEKPHGFFESFDGGQTIPSLDNYHWDCQSFDSQPITPVADYQNFDYSKENTEDTNTVEPAVEMVDREETKLERTESSKSRKSSMIKRKSKPVGPKLSVLSLTGSTIECQLETSKHQTVTFTFETGDAVPADIANNLVSL